MDTEEDMEEMEIAFNKEDTGSFNGVLEWTTSDVVSVDNDISGVEPLEMTNEHKVRLCLDNYSSCKVLLLRLLMIRAAAVSMTASARTLARRAWTWATPRPRRKPPTS